MDYNFVKSNIENGVNVKMECIVQPSKVVSHIEAHSDILHTHNGHDMLENSHSAEHDNNERFTSDGIFSINNDSNSLHSPLIDEEQSEFAVSATAAEAKLQGTVFIEDAIYYRSIHHKANIFCLKLYRWYHSGPVKCAVIVATFLLLMLSFIEEPSSLSWSSDPRRNYTR